MGNENVGNRNSHSLGKTEMEGTLRMIHGKKKKLKRKLFYTSFYFWKIHDDIKRKYKNIAIIPQLHNIDLLAWNVLKKITLHFQ